MEGRGDRRRGTDGHEAAREPWQLGLDLRSAPARWPTPPTEVDPPPGLIVSGEEELADLFVDEGAVNDSDRPEPGGPGVPRAQSPGVRPPDPLRGPVLGAATVVKAAVLAGLGTAMVAGALALTGGDGYEARVSAREAAGTRTPGNASPTPPAGAGRPAAGEPSRATRAPRGRGATERVRRRPRPPATAATQPDGGRTTSPTPAASDAPSAGPVGIPERGAPPREPSSWSGVSPAEREFTPGPWTDGGAL